MKHIFTYRGGHKLYSYKDFLFTVATNKETTETSIRLDNQFGCRWFNAKDDDDLESKFERAYAIEEEIIRDAPVSKYVFIPSISLDESID